MKSSFGRSFTAVATVLMLSLILLGTSFQMLVKQYLTENAMKELQQDAQIVADLASAYSVDGSSGSREFLLNLDVATQVSGFDAVICDGTGEIVICSCSPMVCDHLGWRIDDAYMAHVIETGGETSTGVIKGLYTDSRYVVCTPVPGSSSNGGIVIASIPTASTTAVLNRISNLFLTTSVFVILIAVIVASFFTQRESRPLRDMAKVANAFGHGNLNVRAKVDETTSEEMQELALAFNNMASSLQKSEYQRQEFVANVSHELKTPMTTISGYVDGILDGTIPESRHDHYLQIVSDETKRLSRLVRSMLDISQLQSQDIPEEKKMHFDLEEAVGQVLITFEKKINDKHLEVDVEMPEHPVFTIANRDYVTQVIYNLLDNAVKFCPEGKTLGVRIREGGSKAYISISNQGDTIPAEELPLVFDRFHKLDKSRSKNRDGWGLGLYIVKTIVCSHGENISVTSRDGKTEFTFTMPLVN